MHEIENEKSLESEEVRQFCTFWIYDRLFGIDIIDVKEIYDKVKFTKIYHAVEMVKGYMNIRGQIFLVIDSRLLLGFESKKLDGQSRVVILKQDAAESLGILVDKIGDVIEVAKNQIEERRNQNNRYTKGERRIFNSELVNGICKLKTNLMIIMNGKNILKAIENV